MFLECPYFLPGMLKDQKDCGSGDFITEVVDGVGDKGQRFHNDRCRDILGAIFWRTSRLGIIFVNCRSIRISGVSASRLKELHCTLLLISSPCMFLYLHIIT